MAKKKKISTGFTLIEMMVVVIVFSLMIGTASGVFVSGLKAQKKLLAYQELLDQTSYFMEYISRAVRMAKKDIAGNCTAMPRLNYAITRDGFGLKFKNYRGDCQEFFLDGQTIKEDRGGLINSLFSGAIKISAFRIVLSGESQNDDLQTKATIFLAVEGREKSKIRLQTTVSQRNPDIKR